MFAGAGTWLILPENAYLALLILSICREAQDKRSKREGAWSYGGEGVGVVLRQKVTRLLQMTFSDADNVIPFIFPYLGMGGGLPLLLDVLTRIHGSSAPIQADVFEVPHYALPPPTPYPRRRDLLKCKKGRRGEIYSHGNNILPSRFPLSSFSYILYIFFCNCIPLFNVFYSSPKRVTESPMPMEYF